MGSRAGGARSPGRNPLSGGTMERTRMRFVLVLATIAMTMGSWLVAAGQSAPLTQIAHVSVTPADALPAIVTAPAARHDARALTHAEMVQTVGGWWTWLSDFAGGLVKGAIEGLEFWCWVLTGGDCSASPTPDGAG